MSIRAAQGCPQRYPRRRLAVAISLILAGAAGVTASMPAVAQTSAPVAETQQYDISAGSLTQVLNRFAQRAGVTLSYEPALTEGKSSGGLKGSYSLQEGFGILLQDTGLAAQASGGGYTLMRVPVSPATAGDTTLPTVYVKASGDQSPTTEGTGSYTAHSTNTATKLPLTLRETPQSVTVITRQRIEDQGMTDLSDVYRQTPGLTFDEGGALGTDGNAVYSRGFTVENYMVDGVPQSTTNSWLLQTADLALYDRVEIIRGATGLMSGPGTAAATINLIRKRPTREFQGSATVTAGSWDYKRTDIDISGPLSEQGNVRGRFVAALQDNNFFIDRMTEKKQILYGVVDVDLTPATVLTVGLSHSKQKVDAQARAGFPLFYSDGSLSNFDRSANAAANWAHSYQTHRTFFASVDHQLDNEWVLRANVEHSRRKYDDVIGYAAGGALDPTTGSGLFLWSNMWNSEYIQNSLDLYANGPFELFGRKHELVLGYNTSHMYYDDAPWASWFMLPISNFYTWDGNTPPQPVWPAGDLTDYDEYQSGLYATARFRPTDELSLILGVRSSDWKDESVYTTAAGAFAGSARRKETGVITPYAGAVYDVNKNWSIYASYSDIFKVQNNKTASGSYLDPRTGTNLEAGAKSSFFDERLNFSGAIFQVEEDNLPVEIPLVFAPDGSQAYRSEKGAKTTGYELELSGEIARGWQLMAGYTHRKSKGSTGNAINTQAPRDQFKLYTSYLMAGIGKGLTVGGGVSWQGEVYSDDVGPSGQRLTQDAYAVTDLMARYPLTKDMTVSATVGNLFDEKNYTSTTSSYYVTPRNLRVSLTYKF